VGPDGLCDSRTLSDRLPDGLETTMDRYSRFNGYIGCFVLAVVLTVALDFGSLWLAFCGDWASTQWWCKYGQYALFPISFPAPFIGGSIGVYLARLIHVAVFFAVILYVFQTIQRRRQGPSKFQ
jgi:hypothetical protein